MLNGSSVQSLCGFVMLALERMREGLMQGNTLEILMQISATTPTIPVATAPQDEPTPPFNPGPAPAGTVGPVRRGLATVIRDVGAGLNEASDNMGVAADKAMIHPVEAAYGAAAVIKDKTKNLPKPVAKVASVAGSGLGFVSAYYGLIMGSMIRTPGQALRDIANSVANKIDGQKSQVGDFGASGGLAPDALSGAIIQAAKNSETA